MIDKIKQIISNGEGLTVEFKTCENELTSSVYETVSSFSNRYGGYLLLGVQNDGTIIGVNPDKVSKMKHDFVTAINNPNMMTPTLFIMFESVEIDGMTILWCYIPPHSQIVMYNGKIFDRTEDADLDITQNSEMVAHIHRRKAADYSERKVFPYINESDFEFERLMPIVRTLAVNNQKDHPWGNMEDKEIIQSAGLYQTDPITGVSGYNLAAVLLFGNEKLIRTCTSNYITDAIYRNENVDRYDDRLRITVNLIDAYDQLIGFINKHTNDKFFLIEDIRVSARSWIAREIVSNILVHREFTSAFAAKLIIEPERIVTENWNLPKLPGPINPDNFTPFSKNPMIASFFVNIGRADELGSGVRNLYKYTKMYSGREPELIDGDVFRIIVPLTSHDGTNLGTNLGTNGTNLGINDTEENGEKTALIIAAIRENPSITFNEIATQTSFSRRTVARIIQVLKQLGALKRVGGTRGKWEIQGE